LTSTSSPAPAERISIGTIAAFGTMGVPTASFLLIFGVYLPRYYAGLGMSLIAVGGAIALVRLIDVSFDPLIALLMDRTKTPIGRYRPWLVLGAPIAMAGLYKVFEPNAGVGPAYLVLWLVVVYAGASMLTLGTAAWSAVLATTYHERSRLNGWLQAMAVVGSVVVLTLPVTTHGLVVPGTVKGTATVGWLMVASVPIAMLICTIFTPEKIRPIAAKPQFQLKDYWTALSRPSMRRIILADLVLSIGGSITGPIYIYFFHDAKGFSVAETGLLLMAYIFAGIFGAPFWAGLARKVSKHRSLQTACVAYAVTQTTLMLLPRVWPGHHFAQTLPTALAMFAVGFCAAAFIPLIRAMVADVVDEVRLDQGQDLTSLIYSMVTTTLKVGAAVSTSITFTILGLVGYNGRENAVNTPHAIFGLEMCYLFAPIILIFIGGFAFIGYKLDATRHAEIRRALDERDGGADPAASLESLAGPLEVEAPG
jgi:GPH family glycoside/pentoside/hexuronide:cation symporter